MSVRRVKASLARVVLVAMLCSGLVAARAEAQVGEREVRVYYYEQLCRDPWRALGYEALFPGAGSAYTGLWGNAIFTASLSLLGAGLWAYGALADEEGLWWAGAGTFAVGRSYGLVSAPLGAGLLNRAFRRQLRLTPLSSAGVPSP